MASVRRLVLRGASASPQKTSVVPRGEGPCIAVMRGQVSHGGRVRSCRGGRRSGRRWGSNPVAAEVGLSSVGGIRSSLAVGGGARRCWQTMRLESVIQRWVLRSRAGGPRAPFLVLWLLVVVVRWVLLLQVRQSWTRAGRGARAPSFRFGCPVVASVPTSGPPGSVAPLVASSVGSPAA